MAAPDPDLLPENSWHGGFGARAILRSLAHRKWTGAKKQLLNGSILDVSYISILDGEKVLAMPFDTQVKNTKIPVHETAAAGNVGQL